MKAYELTNKYPKNAMPVGEHIIPKLKDMSTTGKMPKLLSFYRGSNE